MPASVISINDLGPQLMRLAREFENVTKAALFRAAHLAKAQEIAEIDATKPRAPTDTGQMRRSFNVRRLPRYGLDDVAVLMENTSPHAAHQEWGTKAHWVPKGILEEWAQRKVWSASARAPKARKPRDPSAGHDARLAHGPRSAGVGAAGVGKARRVRKLSVDQNKEAKALARRARWAIAQRGVKAKRFHARASAHFGRFVRDELLAGFGRLK
jgi:hypothetical protein